MPSNLSFIKGKITGEDLFVSTRAYISDPPQLRPRNPVTHRNNLLQNLERIKTETESAGRRRVEGASREILVVKGDENYDFVASGYGDKKKDTRVVLEDSERKIAIIDAPSADLTHIKRKLEAYSDDSKIDESTGKRRNQALIDSTESINLASFQDLKGPSVAVQELAEETTWFELKCRGGRIEGDQVSENSKTQLADAFIELDVPQHVLAYKAAEHLVIFAHINMNQVGSLIELVDCIYEIELAPKELINWLVLESEYELNLERKEVAAPAETATRVVVLDTGIAKEHPLLSPILKGSLCAVPDHGVDGDEHNHGTEMAGLSAYGELHEHVTSDNFSPDAWVENAKILVRPHQATGGNQGRSLWPYITKNAVEGIEAAEEFKKRVFVMAVTAELDDPYRATTWSEAVDDLAYNAGNERLLIVSAGNVDVTRRSIIEGYPAVNLDQMICDPSHAKNVLTVGAYTNKTMLPPDRNNYEVMAPKGGISPHTRANKREGSGGAVKPDVVFEGGNVIYDNQLADPGTETLNSLTTNRNFVRAALTNTFATSAASALASNFAAKIWNKAPLLRPSTVRGLIVHSSSWTEQMMEQFPDKKEKLSICGYGVPDFDMASGCFDERGTVIIEDSLPNAVADLVLKSPPPKRPETYPFKTVFKRRVKYFHLPIPEEDLLELEDREVELRVTLSYFAEPSVVNGRFRNGMDLRWDMQGNETEAHFKKKINKSLRDETYERDDSAGYDWEVGVNARSRTTVQSDRWRGPAAMLAGSKLIAVYPVLGWWDKRVGYKEKEQPFSLIVTVTTPGYEIYNELKVAIEQQVEIEV